MPCAGDEDDGDDLTSLAQGLSRECRIVLVSGFESFNVELYKKVCTQKQYSCLVLHASLYQSANTQQRYAIWEGFSGVGHVSKVCWVYMQAARRVKRECPGINVQVFSDRDISDKKGEIEAALQGADVFFGSLLFDYDQVGENPASHQPLLVPKKSQRQILPCKCCSHAAICGRREAVLHSLWVALARQAC